MLNIFNKKDKEVKLNKYKYKILYKNNTTTEGILEVENMDKVYEIFLLNNFNKLTNGTKAYYYNKNEILQLSVEEVEE